MGKSLGLATLEPAFDVFLFASLGDDQRGMAVSVLSVLARSNIDPWQEAARLAALPNALAASSLASTIDANPDPLTAPVDSAALASRLIKLLPRPALQIARIQPVAPGHAGVQITAARTQTAIAAILLVTALIFGMDYLVAARRPMAPSHQSAHTGRTATSATPKL